MATEWHYCHKGDTCGPVSAKELKRLAASGELEPADMVWRDDWDEGVPAARVQGLFPSAREKRPATALPASAQPTEAKAEESPTTKGGQGGVGKGAVRRMLGAIAAFGTTWWSGRGSPRVRRTLDAVAACVVLLALAAIVGLLVYPVVWFFMHDQWDITARFGDDQLQRYAAACKGLPRAPDASPYLKGKVLFLSENNNDALGRKASKIDPLHFSWNGTVEQIRATRPEEVGTVVLVKTELDRAFEYTDGHTAWTPFCTVTIIDLSVPAVVGGRGFTGEKPSSETAATGFDEVGAFPTDKVLDYIAGLPRVP